MICNYCKNTCKKQIDTSKDILIDYDCNKFDFDLSQIYVDELFKEYLLAERTVKK
jgi:hypothetical protein